MMNGKPVNDGLFYIFDSEGNIIQVVTYEMGKIVKINSKMTLIRKISVGSNYKDAMHYIVGQEVLGRSLCYKRYSFGWRRI